MSAVTVVETIHHGNYRNVRTVELDDLSMGSLSRMVSDCPYRVTPPAVRLAMALRSGGSYAYGWVTWEVAR
jgi:hypothetical protein